MSSDKFLHVFKCILKNMLHTLWKIMHTHWSPVIMHIINAQLLLRVLISTTLTNWYFCMLLFKIKYFHSGMNINMLH